MIKNCLLLYFWEKSNLMHLGVYLFLFIFSFALFILKSANTSNGITQSNILVVHFSWNPNPISLHKARLYFENNQILVIHLSIIRSTRCREQAQGAVTLELFTIWWEMLKVPWLFSSKWSLIILIITSHEAHVRSASGKGMWLSR